MGDVQSVPPEPSNIFIRIVKFTSAVTGEVLGVTDWIGQQLHISSKWASRAGFLVLWGIGMTFIEVDEYAVALLLLGMSSVVLFSKAVHWEGLNGRPRSTLAWRILFMLVAVSFIPVSVSWTQARRGTKQWTNFRISQTPASNSTVTQPAQSNPLPGSQPHTNTQTQLPSNSSHPTIQKLDNSHTSISTIESPNDVVLHPYDLSSSRRTKFISLLKPGEGEHDTLRIGCIAWSDSSCVAAGKFLLLFSEAGWAIDSNRVFRAEPMVPTEGMAIVTRMEGEPPKLPPHLGTWEQMDASENTIWKAFREMGVPVSSSREGDLPVGTIEIYFGPEPGPQTIELPLLLSNCEPAGESCDILPGSTKTHGSFVTIRNARQLIHVSCPQRVLFQPDASEKQFSVDEAQLPKLLTLGRCGGGPCRLTVSSFTRAGIVVDSRGATVKTNDGKMQGVLVNWTLLAQRPCPL